MASTGLPHFKNSQAARNNWEPVFNAYFTVSLTPPAGIDNSQWDLVLENVKKIDGIDTSKFFPGAKDQKFKGASRSFVGGKVPTQTFDISLSFEVNLNDSNEMYVFNALRQWCDLVYNPMTGKMGLKKDYVGGPLIISQYNANGDVFRQITFQTVMPMSAVKGPNSFDWEDDNVYVIDGWQLRADDYDEVWL